ncbi:hypothetical protein PAPYR_867 [Paratrimastix pyriformis]|uniref:Uncharacterized protein n=1 Tax=Paratrimastix pyriformis TaxID=342808 RepID=A0ABQ8UV65_9EUKA|nr:hypothetical protein PAPYR_867 [Paratrimastix pyriformis]
MERRAFFILCLALVALATPHPRPPSGAIDVKVQGHGVSIRSSFEKSNNTAIGDVTVDFTTDGFPRYRIKSMQPPASNGTAAVVSQFRVGFLKLVEFVPSNPALGYQPNDTVLQTLDGWRKRQSGWSNVQYDLLRTNTSDGTAVVVRLETHWTMGSTQLMQLVMYISGSTLNASDPARRIDPTSMKIDVFVNGFPWTASQANSTLALAMCFESSGAPGMHNRTGPEGSVETSAGGLAWTREVLADGVAGNLTVSELRDDSESVDRDDDRQPGEGRKVIYFTFPQGHPAKYEWDPQLSAAVDAGQVQPGAAPLGARPLGLAALLGLALLVLA